MTLTNGTGTTEKLAIKRLDLEVRCDETKSRLRDLLS